MHTFVHELLIEKCLQSQRIVVLMFKKEIWTMDNFSTGDPDVYDLILIYIFVYLLLAEFSSALAEVDIGLLAHNVRVTATDTLK